MQRNPAVGSVASYIRDHTILLLGEQFNHEQIIIFFQYNLPFLLGASSRVVEMPANTCLYKSMIREWFCIWRRLMSNHEHEASSQHCDFLLFVVVKGLIKGRLVQVFSYIQGARLVSSVHHPRRRLPRIVQFLQQACLGGIHKANLFARGGGDE